MGVESIDVLLEPIALYFFFFVCVCVFFFFFFWGGAVGGVSLFTAPGFQDVYLLLCICSELRVINPMLPRT